MPLTEIAVPETIKTLRVDSVAEELIDEANERIEAFHLKDHEVIENFVPCDFHLVDQALTWIRKNHLLAGDRFCELGSGFGVAAMLASLCGLESVGIEIESTLVEQANRLAHDRGLAADFYTGSFVPRHAEVVQDIGFDMKHVDTEEGDVYEQIGREMSDFDLFFAFPWPGEHTFFEAVIDHGAATGALLLTYHGREGMRLMRKAD